MAAQWRSAPAVSKAEYLKRYLEPGGSGGEDGAARKKKKKKKRQEGKGMRIVDDDAEDWKKEPVKIEEVVEEEEDQPVNVYAPEQDPELTVEKYERSFEQNEDLGINDMKTEGYEATEKKDHC